MVTGFMSGYVIGYSMWRSHFEIRIPKSKFYVFQYFSILGDFFISKSWDMTWKYHRTCLFLFYSFGHHFVTSLASVPKSPSQRITAQTEN